jgi:hypothetical protein
VAVYKGADGTSGILQGPLAGAYYEGLDSSGYGGMWTAGADGGTLAPTVKVSTTNEIPWEMGMNFASLRLAGQFDGAADSFIMGSGSMITGFLYTTDVDEQMLPLRWGIYGMNFNGESPFGSDYLSVGNIYENTGTSTTWKAKVGGIGPFTLVQAPFFFLGDILNGTWDADGNIEGAILSGIYQTLERRGTFSGPFYGLDGASEEIGYPGSWVGAGVGTYQAQTTEATNAFGGFWGSGYMYPGDGLVEASLFAEDSGYMMRAASEVGLIAGHTKPWEASAKFQVLGMVQYDNVGYWEYARYLFNTPVYATDPARNATLDTAVTDGYFEGYAAGIWRQTLGTRPYYDSNIGTIGTSEFFPVSGSMGGAIRALAVTPADETDGSRTLKILGSDNVLGTYYPGIGMWYAEGNIEPDAAINPQAVLSAVDDDVYIDGNSYNDIHLAGSFDADPTSRIVGGEDYSGYGYGGSFETSYFVISDNNLNPTYSPRWGIYNLMIPGASTEIYNWYEGKPAAPGPWGWSAVVGGQGQFGYGYDGSGDYGYWLASVKGSWAESGEITGTLGFKTGVDGSFGDFVTYTMMGTLGGPFYGIEESADSSTWIGQSIGTYQGTPLAFMSSFSSDLGSTAVNRSGYRDYGDGYYYSYTYGTNNQGSYQYYGTDGNYEMYYYPDGTTQKYYYDTYTYEYGTWDVSQGLSFLETDPFDGQPVPFSEEYASSYSIAWANGILGGTDSPWSATAVSPVDVTVMGEFDSDYEGTAPPSNMMWGTEISSYNYLDGSTTTYDDGAYTGFMGGIAVPKAGVPGEASLSGMLLALYIDPSGNGGYLRGNLEGTAYSSIGMFEMTGGLYPEQKTVVDVDPVLDPLNIGNHVQWGYGYMNGLAGAFDGTGWIHGTGDGNFTTAWLYDYANNWAAPWGIYQFQAIGMYANPDAKNTWQAIVGGQGTFEMDSDEGYWLANVDGGVTGSVLNGTLSGIFITPKKLGTLSGISSASLN